MKSSARFGVVYRWMCGERRAYCGKLGWRALVDGYVVRKEEKPDGRK